MYRVFTGQGTSKVGQNILLDLVKKYNDAPHNIGTKSLEVNASNEKLVLLRVNRNIAHNAKRMNRETFALKTSPHALCDGLHVYWLE